MFFHEQVRQGVLGLPVVAGGATDPNFASVKLLLHGEGTNGGTTITDSSSNAYSPTFIDEATTSTTQFKYGSSSISFPGNQTGSNNYLVWAGTDGDFVWRNTAFTVEAFVRFNSLTSIFPHIFQTGNTGGRNVLYVNGSKLRLYSDTGGDSRIVGATTLAINTWYHIALTNEVSGTTNTVKLWLDGVQEGSTYTVTNGFSNPANMTFAIGNPYYSADNNNSVNGYYDEVRYTKGVARYTATFTPPTAAHPDS